MTIPPSRSGINKQVALTRAVILCSAIGKEFRFKYPCTCIIPGPTGSGKSTFCKRFLQKLSSLCTEHRFEGGILWCFTQRTSIPTKELDALNQKIRYLEGVPFNFKNPIGKSCLFILDDLLNDAYSSERVCVY